MKVTGKRRTKEELRVAYKNIQEAAVFTVDRKEWRIEVDKIALKLAATRLKAAATTEEVLPSEWLKAAELATVTCPKCHGSGEYRWGACVNGKPPAKGGPCFACEGKGRQDQDDFFRNRAYWRRAIARAVG